MKRSALVVFAAFGLACATLSGLESPDVHVANLVPLESTLFEQSVRVDLRVYNPNDTDLAIRGLRFTLYVNDRVLARGGSNESASIPAFGDALVSVVARSSSLDLLRQVLALPQEDTLEYELDGDVFLEGFGRRRLGFEREGRFTLPVNPVRPLVPEAPVAP